MLTPRQEAFIRQLIDLYRQVDGPIHYAELGKALGVSRFTAYDMLRVLEEKGLVMATYTVGSGPGRSKVVFEPTPAAHGLMAQVAEGSSDWEEIKDRAIRRIRAGRNELTEDILERIPAEPDNYCLELITVLTLRLDSASRRLLSKFLDQILPQDEPATQSGLNLFCGFALGLLAGSITEDGAWMEELSEHVRRYQDSIAAMSPADRAALTADLHNALVVLREANSQP